MPKLLASSPHLIFLDMHMPGMDEEAKICIRHLRMTPELKHVPLVALTTDKHYSKYQSDYQSVGVEFLIKPFGIGDIVRVIKKHQNDLLIDEAAALISEKISNSAKVLNSRSEQELVLNQIIIKELDELTRIPIFKGRTIINRLNKIKEEHVLSVPNFHVFIGNLKSAVFEGDRERFITIIKKAMKKNRR
jgi:CheY-like chemotaxis protein